MDCDITNLSQIGLDPSLLSLCYVRVYFQVAVAKITNFPPSITTLKIFLDTLVITHTPADECLLNQQWNGQISHFSQASNNPIIPGNHFI